MDIPPVLGEFGTVMLALVIVLDPLGLVPVVISVTSRLDAAQTRHIVYKAVGGATILLLFFTITGTLVLRLLGVTLNDLRIGGGLLLVIISLKMLVEGHIGAVGDDDHAAAIIPLISPFLIGPGAITAAVVLASIHGVLLTSIAAIGAMIICLVAFLSSRFVCRLIGDSGAQLVTRIMGVLIASIAVAYIREGLVNALRGVR